MRRDMAHKNSAEKDKLLFQKHPIVLQSVRVRAMLGNMFTFATRPLCMAVVKRIGVSEVDALSVCCGKAGLILVAWMCCYARWDEINTGLVIVD